MPQIKLPSGEVVNFPDTMSDDEIVAAIKGMSSPVNAAPTPEAAPTPTQAPEQSAWDKFRQTPFGENVIGYGEVDTPGEKAGEYARAGLAATVRGMADTAGMLLGGPAELMGIKGMVPEGINVPSMRDMGRQAISDLTFGASESRVPGRLGEIISTAGEVAGGSGLIAGPKAMLKYGFTPGAVSEIAGGSDLIEGTKAEPWVRGAALLGTPLAQTGIANMGRRMATPHPTDPARIAFANQLDDAGVQTTAGQQTGSKNLMYKEGATAKGQQIAAEQGEQFTTAALRTTGSTARRATPEAMTAQRNILGNTFDDLAARNNIVVDKWLVDDVATATDDYMRLTARGNAAPILRDMLRNFTDRIKNGELITGREYQSFRTKLGKALKGTDGNLREGAGDVQQALDNAMERTIQASGSVDDIAAYALVRDQYRNYLAIEKSVSGASTAAAYGIINPDTLRSAMVQQSKGGYVRGTRELDQLARAGKGTIVALPDSGTAGRMAALGTPTGAGMTGATIGGGVGFVAGGPVGAGIGTAIGTGVGNMTPRMAQALRMTDLGQKYLANQQFASPSRTLMDKRLLGTIASGMANR